MRTQILIPFQGQGSGTEELSWGQKSMWATMSREGQSITLGEATALPAGVSEEVIVKGLRFLMGRHQALRTKYEVQPDGSALQVLYSSGVLTAERVETGDRDPVEVASEIREDYQNRDFDYPNEWPLRAAIVSQHGQITHVVAIYLHLAIDAGGLQALLADLATMDPETGQSDAPVTAMQPSEQARWQRSPAARRQSDASLKHLERVLRTVPIRRFPDPTHEGEPSFPQLELNSPATRLAIRAISQRLNIDTSPILLGLYATAVTRLTGKNPFVTILAVSNRFRPGFADSVSQLAQVSPCMIDLADATVEEAIVRARRAAVSAYKYAYYNPLERRELIARITEDRGERVETSIFFNDRREDRDLDNTSVPGAEQILAALPRSELRWVPDHEEIPETLYFSVDDAEDAVVFVLSGDTRYLPPEQMQELAYAIEALAVEAALNPQASTLIRSVQVAV